MKKMVYPYSRFMVDAGNISVLDAKFIKRHGGDPTGSETTTIRLPKPGSYDITIQVKNCWLGRVKKTGTIVAESDELVVGDACYSWSDASQPVWERFLDYTDSLSKFFGSGLGVDTGGDGLFEVKITVEDSKCVAPRPEEVAVR